MNADSGQKVRENRLRAAVARQGYRLVKSRRRDPKAVDHGRYYITDASDRRVADLPDLDAVDRWVGGER
jgi:hypothetical protein